MYPSIVFDCANTLLLLQPSDSEVYARVLCRFGMPIDAKAVNEVLSVEKSLNPLASKTVDSDVSRRKAYRKFNVRVLASLGVDQPKEELLNAIDIAMDGRYRWSPAPGVEQVLFRLSKKASLFVFSNWSRGLAKTLETHRLKQYFHGVTSSEQLGLEKPNLEAFERFLSIHKLTANECCYVGDDYELDIRPSSAVGMYPIWLTTRSINNSSNLKTASDWMQVEKHAMNWISYFESNQR